MPTMPKKITVDRRDKKLYVDGVEFPWFITEEGPSAEGLAGNHEIPRVTLGIFAEDIEVIPADKDT